MPDLQQYVSNSGRYLKRRSQLGALIPARGILPSSHGRSPYDSSFAAVHATPGVQSDDITRISHRTTYEVLRMITQSVDGGVPYVGSRLLVSQGTDVFAQVGWVIYPIKVLVGLWSDD